MRRYSRSTFLLALLVLTPPDLAAADPGKNSGGEGGPTKQQGAKNGGAEKKVEKKEGQGGGKERKAPRVASPKRLKAEKIIAETLVMLKGISKMDINPGNQAQVKSVLQKLSARKKKLCEAKSLYMEGLIKEVGVINDKLIEAKLEAAKGHKVDTTALREQRHDLAMGGLKEKTTARISSIKILIDALKLYIQGDMGGAIVETSRAIKADKTLGLAYMYHGSFNYLTRNIPMALKSWREALKLDPDNEDLRRTLAELDRAGR